MMWSPCFMAFSCGWTGMVYGIHTQYVLCCMIYVHVQGLAQWTAHIIVSHLIPPAIATFHTEGGKVGIPQACIHPDFYMHYMYQPKTVLSLPLSQHKFLYEPQHIVYRVFTVYTLRGPLMVLCLYTYVSLCPNTHTVYLVVSAVC